MVRRSDLVREMRTHKEKTKVLRYCTLPTCIRTFSSMENLTPMLACDDKHLEEEEVGLESFIIESQPQPQQQPWSYLGVIDDVLQYFSSVVTAWSISRFLHFRLLF